MRNLDSNGKKKDLTSRAAGKTQGWREEGVFILNQVSCFYRQREGSQYMVLCAIFLYNRVYGITLRD
jgi:hypothetical protein